MLNALVTAVTFVLWWQAAAAAKLQVKGNLNSAGFLDLLATAPGYDARKSVLKVCNTCLRVAFLWGGLQKHLSSCQTASWNAGVP
jgi:hypothetical protein